MDLSFAYIKRKCKKNRYRISKETLCEQTIESHISKFAEINRRYNFNITIQQLLRDDNICCFTRMIRIPKHILVPFLAQTRSRSARYYTCILSSITATSLCRRFEPFKVYKTCVYVSNVRVGITEELNKYIYYRIFCS